MRWLMIGFVSECKGSSDRNPGTAVYDILSCIRGQAVAQAELPMQKRHSRQALPSADLVRFFQQSVTYASRLHRCR